MTLITENLIRRETFEVSTITPVNSAQYYSNKYLVIDVAGGSSQTIPYPGIKLQQVFLGSGGEVIGAQIDLKQGNQLVEMLPLGVYYLRLVAQGAIPRATVKIWENTGNIYNYFAAGEDTPGGLGNDGLSAYQIAVIKVFEGTESEWLESLKGQPGANGQPGISAYQLAVSNGFVGTLPQWLDGLKGAKGDKGDKGDTGATGAKGDKGDTGDSGLVGGILTLPHVATPNAPNAGNTLVYAKSDGMLYRRSPGGTELAIGSGGGGGGGREILAANRTYFVRTDGNDNNDGLTNTAGGAFLTIQKAIDVVASLDCSIYFPTIQIADGDYSNQSTIILKDPISISGALNIKGNTTNRKAVKTPGFSATSIKKNPVLDSLWIFPSGAFGINAFSSELQVVNCAFSTEINQAGIVATDNSVLRVLNFLEFDTSARNLTYNYILVARSSIVNAASVSITKTGGGTTQDADFVADELSFLQLAYTTGSNFSSASRNRSLVRLSNLTYQTS